MKINRKQPALPGMAGGPISDLAPVESAPAEKAGSLRRGANSKGPSKQDRVLVMLRQKGGTTIAAIMKTTDWQQHSVRGFLAGVVRKKLGPNLVSDASDRGRTYRIEAGKSAKKASTNRKRRG